MGENALNCISTRFPINGEKRDYYRRENEKRVLVWECWKTVRPVILKYKVHICWWLKTLCKGELCDYKDRLEWNCKGPFKLCMAFGFCHVRREGRAFGNLKKGADVMISVCSLAIWRMGSGEGQISPVIFLLYYSLPCLKPSNFIPANLSSLVSHTPTILALFYLTPQHECVH